MEAPDALLPKLTVSKQHSSPSMGDAAMPGAFVTAQQLQQAGYPVLPAKFGPAVGGGGRSQM